MNSTPNRSFRAAIPWLVLALAALPAGCGKESTVTPVPDCAGIHLLVLASDRNVAAGLFDVYLYDLDAGGFRVIALNSTSADVNPAITRDGGAIAVQTHRAITGQDVRVYDRCTASFLDRPELATAFDESDPTFSGNANLLAFVRDTLGHGRLRVLDGLNRRFVPLPLLDAQAAGNSFDDHGPTLDQTGRLIAFTTNRGGNDDVWIYDRTGDSVLTLPELATAAAELEPSITPDGRYLAFASDRAGGDGGFDVYLYDLQTRAMVATAGLNSPADDRHPAVNTDAGLIVFESNRTGTGAQGGIDVWNYNRSGGVVAQGIQQSSAASDVDPALAWP
ncbi:MAG: hypothetical protein HOP12_12020 [Candidatus Eisenbacteria bacterium]|uniref:Uncharacterized protein n=1 Tax=Eiseniibacteriota bacterium TaxID=2212470 RepID=A0A849SKA3_UNCEI|nr:hypothetical protein [Candidatus Eisenbacteria bacterium]